MHREPDVGFDPGSPGSCPGPKAGAKPLSHPGIPGLRFKERTSVKLQREKNSSFYEIQLLFGHSALSKMTRRKNSPQKKESEIALSPKDLQNLYYNSVLES